MMNNNAMMQNNPAEIQNFILPEMMEDEFSSDDLGTDFDGIHISFRRVKIPSGGALQFELPSDDPEQPEYARTIEGIILFNHAACSYWPGGAEYDENTPPLCSSPDGKTGYGTPGGACELCAFNKYNTATDSKGNMTKGKACKNMRQLYILRSGEPLPILLSLPPTSLRNFNDFINLAFVNRKRPSWASVIQIGLKRVENGVNTYSVATFRKLYDISGEQIQPIREYAANFREQVQASISQPPVHMDTVVEELPASTAAPAYSTVYGSVIDGDRDELPL